MSLDAEIDFPSSVRWSPPVYDTSRSPRQSHSMELAQTHSGENSTADPSVFARMAKWCPDGSVALAQCEDSSFRFLQLPPELLGGSADATFSSSLPHRLAQSSPILDYAWYPTASIQDPASFCFVASVRECPIKLLDASDGRLRASYRIVDHRERQVAPHSLAFNVGANRLYCGFEDAIEVFDVHRPGEGTRLRTTPSKKSRDGLKGIISALAFAPDVSSDIYAAGSFSPSSFSSSNIAIFSESNGEVPVMFLGAGTHHAGAGYGIRASVSQLMFNRARPFLLYASFRRVDTIYSWDVRGDVTRPVETFNTTHNEDHNNTDHTLANRKTRQRTSTNQRLRFDVDYNGQLLAAGDEDGGISVFDLAAHTSHADAGGNAPHEDSTLRTLPVIKYDGHRDAVGSVAFHPLRPVLLSVSGSRHFEPTHSSSGSTSGSSSDEDNSQTIKPGEACREKPNPRVITRNRNQRQPVALDTSIKVWAFEHSTED